MSKEKMHSLLFPIFDVMLNGFNFIIILYISYRLTLDGFGIFSALMAMVGILFIVGVSVQTYVAKNISKARDATFLLKGIGGLLFANFIIVLMIPLFANILRSSWLSIIMIAVMWNLHIVLSMDRGMMQGKKRFKDLNISFYIEVLIRITATIISLRWYQHYEMAIGGVLIGIVAALVHSRWLVQKNYLRRSDEDNKNISNTENKAKLELRRLMMVMVGNGFIYYLSGINIIIVNRRIPIVSAEYGLASKFGALIVAVIMSIVTVLIPYMGQIGNDEKAIKKFSRRWFFVMGSIGIGIWLGYIFVGPIIFPIIFKEGYKEVGNIIPYQSIAYIAMSVTQVTVAFNIINERFYHLRILAVGAIAFTITLVTVPAVIQWVIGAEIAINVLMLLVHLWFYFERRQGYEEEYAISLLERHQTSK